MPSPTTHPRVDVHTDLLSGTVDTPAGPLTILATENGGVRAAGFGSDTEALLTRVHPRLRGPVRPQRDLGAVTEAVHSYLDGDLAALDRVPVEQYTDGQFLAHTWDVLRRVPAGPPVTYTTLAALSGRPLAVRAAAAACARNGIALFVPCHRVVRVDGGLGGYRWGLDVKKWLLGHEGAMATS